MREKGLEVSLKRRLEMITLAKGEGKGIGDIVVKTLLNKNHLHQPSSLPSSKQQAGSNQAGTSYDTRLQKNN
eukprot:scaffold8970_cov249-Skeletonema_marinoi.AAC.1